MARFVRATYALKVPQQVARTSRAMTVKTINATASWYYAASGCTMASISAPKRACAIARS